MWAKLDMQSAVNTEFGVNIRKFQRAAREIRATPLHLKRHFAPDALFRIVISCLYRTLDAFKQGIKLRLIFGQNEEITCQEKESGGWVQVTMVLLHVIRAIFWGKELFLEPKPGKRTLYMFPERWSGKWCLKLVLTRRHGWECENDGLWWIPLRVWELLRKEAM